jgi:hypothetical protein
MKQVDDLSRSLVAFDQAAAVVAVLEWPTEFRRRSQARTASIKIRGGGDTGNAVASTPRDEWARRLGASHSKRMAALWSNPEAGLTEYKVAE